MPLRQKDIAEMLGVHPATVSRSLRDDPSIPETMRSKVKKLAKEYGYQPNYHARSLRAQETKLISVLKKDLEIKDLHGMWIRNLLIAALDLGYKARIDPLDDAEKVMLEGSADGFIAFGDEILPGEHLELKDAIKPVVFIDCSPEDMKDFCVFCDNSDGAVQAVRHLTGLGHRRIAFFGLVEWSRICRERHKGYLKGLSESKLDEDPGLTIPHYFWSNALSQPEEFREPLLTAVRNGATAVIASSDINAIGAMRILKSAGYGIPGDVSVVGFDDSIISEVCEPPLTTVRQDTEATSKRAVRLLVDLLKGDHTPGARINLPTSLILRNSTGPIKGS